ncbi:DNA polymerase IV [Fructilactobacillus ixorae]|uniref:DNA polymerase IV n=1 Tax=Fructilactobacillus ixorae TaxID=1750535 RepID=A0ABY5C5B4_9LACO|nr:DNA polymerase IV [Fructilactobacillus ixorae]USS93762.1 DNA polymerase IV [Fructilactobacillus ixorae]
MDVQAELQRIVQHRILHVDMDAFFASIEEREHPELAQVPLVIAKDPRKTGGHGVVTTANYRARQYGVHSAMPASQALELCPHAVFKAPDFELFRTVSDQIHELFHEYTDRIETVALDEAYLEITTNKLHLDDAVLLAHWLQSEIWEQTHLTSSTGLSYSKFLAKEASDYRKPAGMTVINPDEAQAFLWALPIGKYRGVGKKTLPKMEALGIKTGADLYQFSELELMNQFGKFGYFLYRRVRGIDARPVEYQRERKSIGKERTYNPLLHSRGEVQTQLRRLAELVVAALQRHQKHGKTVVLKLRYQDFSTLTKRVTEPDFLPLDAQKLYERALTIFDDLPPTKLDIRLVGITVTNLAELNFQTIDLPLTIR